MEAAGFQFKEKNTKFVIYETKMKRHNNAKRRCPHYKYFLRYCGCWDQVVMIHHF